MFCSSFISLQGLSDKKCVVQAETTTVDMNMKHVLWVGMFVPVHFKADLTHSLSSQKKRQSIFCASESLQFITLDIKFEVK
jgi:hypothetical protein